MKEHSRPDYKAFRETILAQWTFLTQHDVDSWPDEMLKDMRIHGLEAFDIKPTFFSDNEKELNSIAEQIKADCKASGQALYE